ncbi:helix-turn-helix domain-containing protein [Microbacterium xylanilyticum]
MNEQQKAQAAELHDQGLGCSAIAKQVGVHPSTISRWAAKEGLDFDRTQTAVAVRSAVVSRASRRQQITDRIYSQIEALLDRMQYRPDGGWKALVKDGKGGERFVTVDELPIRDLRDLAASLNALLFGVSALERSNAMFAQEETVESARSLLGSLAEALGVTNPDGSPVR